MGDVTGTYMMVSNFARALVLTVATLIGLSDFNAAKAAIVTYDLALTPISGSGTTLTGTGVLSVVGPISNNNFGAGSPDVTNLNISIDGLNFNLTNTFSAVDFRNGGLTDITAAGSASGHPLAVLIVSSLTSVFLNFGNGAYGFDTITATPAGPSAAPLPATWALMLSVLVGIGFIGYRRRTKSVFMWT
jgi:hypothetical protein